MPYSYPLEKGGGEVGRGIQLEKKQRFIGNFTRAGREEPARAGGEKELRGVIRKKKKRRLVWQGGEANGGDSDFFPIREGRIRREIAWARRTREKKQLEGEALSDEGPSVGVADSGRKREKKKERSMRQHRAKEERKTDKEV